MTLTVPDKGTSARIDPDDMIKVMPMRGIAERDTLSQLLKRDAETVIDLATAAG